MANSTDGLKNRNIGFQEVLSEKRRQANQLLNSTQDYLDVAANMLRDPPELVTVGMSMKSKDGSRFGQHYGRQSRSKVEKEQSVQRSLPSSGLYEPGPTSRLSAQAKKPYQSHDR